MYILQTKLNIQEINSKNLYYFATFETLMGLHNETFKISQRKLKMGEK